VSSNSTVYIISYIEFFLPSRHTLLSLPIPQVRWLEKGDRDLLWGGVEIRVPSKQAHVLGPVSSDSGLPVRVLVLGAESAALLSSILRVKLFCGVTEIWLTFTPRFGVELIDDISDVCFWMKPIID